MMTNTDPIDPRAIFLQAQSFQAVRAIVERRVKGDDYLTAQVGFPIGTICALTIELLLKCLICLASGSVPRDHHLARLFDQLNAQVKNEIESKWDNEIVPLRASEWDKNDAIFDKKMNRTLRSALDGASYAFEELRYVYEGMPKTVFNVSDVPTLLAQVIFNIKPDWKDIGRKPRSAQP